MEEIKKEVNLTNRALSIRLDIMTSKEMLLMNPGIKTLYLAKMTAPLIIHQKQIVTEEEELRIIFHHIVNIINSKYG